MLPRLLFALSIMFSTPVWAQGQTSSDSGVVVANATPANSSHAGGVSVGGLFTLPMARLPGGSGIITNFGWVSTGASVGAYVARVWQAKPSNTTCIDNVAFIGSTVDDANLITMAPFTITPVAPTSTQGDANTYATVPSLTWDYRNRDSPPTQNLYVCIITVLTDTADDGHLVRVMMSGPQN
jgi:hypothetical protein